MNCYKCKKEVTKDDFCHGCNYYICDDCALPDCEADYSGRQHDVEDHFREHVEEF